MVQQAAVARLDLQRLGFVGAEQTLFHTVEVRVAAAFKDVCLG